MAARTPRQVSPNNDFLRKVFGWMFLGLLVSAFSAYAAISVPAIKALVSNTIFFWSAIILELVLVFVISLAIKKLSPELATGLFVIYALLTGLTISVILIAYSIGAAALAFVTAAGMFGVMSLWGYYTKSDMSTFGMILFMALIGLIIATLVNLFLKSPMLHWIVTYASVLIFAGLTAYDIAQLKKQWIKNPEEQQKAAIIGALALYINFINMFLALLQIFGGGGDN